MAWIHDLKTSFEPDGQGDADDKANDVDEGLVEDDDDGGAETHRERQVEVFRQLGPTMKPD